MPYVVATDPCSYLLSDDGICVRVQPTGTAHISGTQDAPQAPQTAVVGAQFVAGLDVSVPGGLVGGLEIGSAALFVKQDEKGRFVLLRTAPIRTVTERGLKRKPPLPKTKAEGDETTLTQIKTQIAKPPPVPRVAPAAPSAPAPPAPPRSPVERDAAGVPLEALPRATRPDLPAPPIFHLAHQSRPMAPSVFPSPWDEPPTHRMMRDDMRKAAKKKKK